MSRPLTKDAVIQCPHKGGVVIVVADPLRKLTVAGAPVLLQSDFTIPAAISSPACSQPMQSRDLTVTSVGGEATKLTIGQKGVLLDDQFTGKTNLGQSLSVATDPTSGALQAGQSKLTAR